MIQPRGAVGPRLLADGPNSVTGIVADRGMTRPGKGHMSTTHDPIMMIVKVDKTAAAATDAAALYEGARKWWSAARGAAPT